MKTSVAVLLITAATLASAHGPCSAAEFGNRGCDSSNVLWQCDRTKVEPAEYSWVVENDCGAVGYACNAALNNPAASVGCQPPPPKGAKECSYGQWGSYQCDGQTLQQCAYDPWWVTATTCGAGYTCFASPGFTNCVPIGVPVKGTSVTAQNNSGSSGSGSGSSSSSGASSTKAATGSSANAAAAPASEGAVAPVSSSSISTAGVAAIAIVGVVALAVVGGVVYSRSKKAAAPGEVLGATNGLLSAWNLSASATTLRKELFLTPSKDETFQVEHDTGRSSYIGKPVIIIACIVGTLLGSTFFLLPKTVPEASHHLIQVIPGTNHSSLSADYLKFPVESIIALSGQKGSEKEIDEHIADLIELLVPHVAKDPAVPASETCLEPAMHEDDLRCSDYPDIFEPTPAKTPRRMSIALQFAFDVDNLEIALHQYHTAFDHIFLLESMVAQHHKIRKPLVWEMLKATPRFKKFANQVIHIVDDDSTAFTAGKPGHEKDTSTFGHEWHQEQARWDAIKSWNLKTKYYGDEDLIAFGDVDEIPSLRNIRLLKNCVLKASPVDIGIWFTMGRLPDAFATDFPVAGHPYSLGDPTFFKFKDAIEYEKKENKFPGRLRGHSGRFLLGGAHLTNYGYLPYQMLKRISCSECGLNNDLLLRWRNSFLSSNVFQLETEMSEDWIKMFKDRIKPISEINDTSIVSVPWFLECNLKRFPMWMGDNDLRNL
ncbi:hypothetical protein BDR26DRAFT_930630 [Obelidium mucronatum]|nr:hypothetical protein BDR26DRAFT_930630 [Obelidium mucronatum]